LLIAAACALAAREGDAVQVDFQLTGPNSLLAAPFVVAVQQPMVAQDPEGKSLTTTYSGTITVDVDNLANPTSITFISAHAVAANSGNWLPAVGGGTEGDPGIDGDADPGAPAPANYGFVLDLGGPAAAVLYGASRDTIFSLDGAARSVTSGEFDPGNINITVPQGTFDGNLSSGGFGDNAGQEDATDLESINCTHLGCGFNGSYAVAGNLATLTLPIDFKIGGGTPEVGFSGTLVATFSLVQPLAGDYNDDGAVDAADYVVWRKNDISQTGYDTWRTNYGRTSGSGSGVSAAVPEPITAQIFLAGILALCLRRRAAAS
jgi:hypothetical protein